MEIKLEMIDIIKQNLKNLDLVCEKFPILEKYRTGGVHANELYNLGLNNYINFIDYLKRLNQLGFKPYYDEKIKYKQLKSKLVELAPAEKSAKTFGNKSETDFLLVMTNEKTARRYIRSYNQSYFSGIFKGEALILNYLIQKLSEVESDINIQRIGESLIHREAISTDICKSKFSVIDTIFNNSVYYTKVLELPKFRNLEFEMVDTFISKFQETLGDFDFRKCNWNLLQNKMIREIESRFTLEKGSTVKALNDIEVNSKLVIEKDKLYRVEQSYRTNEGFLNITINVGDKNHNFPYYNFEEISRMRDDILNQLFGNSGS